MRSLVGEMVGMVGLCVLWGVCLVVVVLLGGCGCVLLGVRGVIVESVLGWCAGWVGVSGGKKTYYLVAPFEIADFRGE